MFILCASAYYVVAEGKRASKTKHRRLTSASMALANEMTLVRNCNCICMREPRVIDPEDTEFAKLDYSGEVEVIEGCSRILPQTIPSHEMNIVLPYWC